MFNKWLSGRHNRPPVNDTKLNGLLQEWQAIKPSANFNSDVWRRIRLTSTQERPSFIAAIPLREWFVPRLAWVNVLAAAAGIIMGLGLAFSAPAMSNRNHNEETLLSQQTLAGSYLAMAAGGTR